MINHRPDLNTRQMFVRTDDHASAHVFSTPVRRARIPGIHDPHGWLALAVVIALTALACAGYCLLAGAGVVPNLF